MFHIFILRFQSDYWISLHCVKHNVGCPGEFILISHYIGLHSKDLVNADAHLGIRGLI